MPISSPRPAWISSDERLMAARRLLIVMLILLGLSTLAAALLPPQALREDTTESTSTTEATETTPTDAVRRGKQLPQQRIKVGGRKIPVVSCPAPLRRADRCTPIEAGDQLSLVVSSRKADQLEMPAFGLVDSVGPNEPGRFEILVRSPGSYKIRFVSTGRIAARIEVEKPGTGKSGKKKPDKKPRSRAPGEPARS